MPYRTTEYVVRECPCGLPDAREINGLVTCKKCFEEILMKYLSIQPKYLAQPDLHKIFRLFGKLLPRWVWPWMGW